MARLILFIIVFTNLNFSYAADPVVTITEDFSNTSLKEVFMLLKNKYQLKIAYSERLIKNVAIDEKVSNLSIAEVFEVLLQDVPLTFEYIAPDAIIVKKDESKEGYFDLVGEVIDQESGERLPFAYLFLEPINRVVTSNEDGLFSLNGMSNDAVLKASYLGYNDTIISLGDEVKKQRLIISLKRSLSTLDAVVVHDQNTQSFNPDLGVNVVSLSPSFASQLPQAAEPDVFRTMQLLPGVNGTNELSSGLFINGGTANQNMVIFDGIPIYHVDHFFGYFSAINPYAIKSMRLFKGGFDAKYGGRSSSLVEFTGKDGSNSKVGGNVSFNLLSANTSLEVPMSENTTLFLSARRSYTDILSTSLFEKIFTLYEKQLNDDDGMAIVIKDQQLSPEFYYKDLNFKVSTKLGARNNLSFSYYDSNDILNYNETYQAEFLVDTVVDVQNVGFVNWGNIGASLKWSTLWSNNHYSNFLASYSHYSSTYQELSAQNIQVDNQQDIETNTATNQDNFIKDISLKVDHEWTVGINRIEFGAAASLYQARINSTLDENIITYKNQNQVWLHVQYIQNHFQLSEATTISLGVRNNYLSTMSKFFPEPRFSFTHELNNQLQWNGSLGVYRQFVNQINTENALEGSRDLWVVSDEEVPNQRAIHAITGLSRSKKGFLLSTNLFYKKFDGLMDYAFSEGGLITEYENYEDLFFEGEGTAYGMEFLAKYESKSINAWASYTLSKVVYQFPDLNNGNSFSADHDQRHELNLFTSYKIGNFEIFGTWFYGSGKPYNKLVLETTQTQNQGGKDYNVSVLRQEGKNNQRLPKYHRLDLGLNYYLSLAKSEMRFTASVFNLYNRSNVYDRKLEIIEAIQKGDKRRKESLSALPYDVNLMGITPSLSIEFSF